MDNKEKIGKILLIVSIAIDIFFYICFFIGIAIGIGSGEIGFTMLGIVFKYGLAMCIISSLLKISVAILSFHRDTKTKRILLHFTFFSAKYLLFIGSFIGFIYYIGKVMSSVG